jgi:hypothetical protein
MCRNVRFLNEVVDQLAANFKLNGYPIGLPGILPKVLSTHSIGFIRKFFGYWMQVVIDKRPN